MLLAGCRVDARVDIGLRDGGSGTVRAHVVFDADAARRVGGIAALRLDDLRAAGWEIATDPRSVTLMHEFSGRDDLATRLSDLVGATGILRDARITRERGWFTRRDEVSVVVDTRRLGAGVRDDAQLVARLREVGVDVDALAARFDAQLHEAIHLEVAVRLPDGRSRSVTVGAGAVSTVTASARDIEGERVAGAAAAASLVLMAGVLLLLARRGRNRVEGLHESG
jgi:hypothetical protein